MIKARPDCTFFFFYKNARECCKVQPADKYFQPAASCRVRMTQHAPAGSQRKHRTTFTLCKRLNCSAPTCIMKSNRWPTMKLLLFPLKAAQKKKKRKPGREGDSSYLVRSGNVSALVSLATHSLPFLKYLSANSFSCCAHARLLNQAECESMRLSALIRRSS